jgi:hypothetical protein
MKITASKIKRELRNDIGWREFFETSNSYEKYVVDEAIKDTLKVINEILKYQKNISIK